MSDEIRLTNTLMQRYQKIGKLARPVKNSSKPVKVGLALMLYQLINIDESEQFITLKLWMHIVSTLTFIIIITIIIIYLYPAHGP